MVDDSLCCLFTRCPATPGRPPALRLHAPVALNESLLIKWEPMVHGSDVAPVLAVEAAVEDTGVVHSGPVSDGSLLVTALPNGAAAELSVRARNEYGCGPSVIVSGVPSRECAALAFARAGAPGPVQVACQLAAVTPAIDSGDAPDRTAPRG